VASGQPASYDEGRATVVSASLSWFRVILAGAIAIAVLLGVAGLSAWDKQDRANVQRTQMWTNPVTGKTAQISNTWTNGTLPGPDGTLYHFTSDFLMAEGLLGVEEFKSTVFDINRYASALENALSGNFNFYDSWSALTVGGRETRRAFATSREDPAVDVQITVTIDGGRAWRVLVFSRGRKASEMPLSESFVGEMFGTI
jgi:hypothetical protein